MLLRLGWVEDREGRRKICSLIVLTHCLLATEKGFQIRTSLFNSQKPLMPGPNGTTGDVWIKAVTASEITRICREMG